MFPYLDVWSAYEMTVRSLRHRFCMLRGASNPIGREISVKAGVDYC